MKCLSRVRNGEPCRCAAVEETRFCKFHQYMTAYTDAMLENTEMCSGCKKMYYFGEGRKICDKCADRSKANRTAKREHVVLCAKDACIYKRSDENKYCKLHQTQLFVDETIAENKKLCKGYTRGCRNKLEQSYSFSKCQDCLEKDRDKDNDRRTRVLNADINVAVQKACPTCCKILPIDHFAGERTASTSTCKLCRESNKIQDAKRDKAHRNEIARVNDVKPERIQVKQQWKEDNYEKVAEYNMNARQHRIEREGIDEYMKNGAIAAQKWRDNNPEKVQQNNENKINSYEIQYGVYVRSAELKQIRFGLSFDEFKEIVNKPCHYCGILRDRGTEQFNGIDRDDSSIGYLPSNCVSCCSMCNYMKNTLSGDVFVRRVEHILTHNKHVDGVLNPNLFGDHNSVICMDYKRRAIRKQLEFSLTNDEFNQLTLQECYICGKKSTRTHKNGVDRYDNTSGYTLDNCRSCCGECNYMKCEYSYDDLFDKLKLIYNYKPVTEQDVSENISIVIDGNADDIGVDANVAITAIVVTEPDNITVSLIRGNKKTPEQIKEACRLRKQKQRAELQAKYGDDEYKKKHAKEIAEARLKRKQNAVAE